MKPGIFLIIGDIATCLPKSMIPSLDDVSKGTGSWLLGHETTNNKKKKS